MTQRIIVQNGYIVYAASDETHDVSVNIKGTLGVTKELVLGTNALAGEINSYNNNLSINGMQWPDGSVTPEAGMVMGVLDSSTLQYTYPAGDDNLFMFQVGVVGYEHIHYAPMTSTQAEYLVGTTNKLLPVGDAGQPFIVITTNPSANSTDTNPDHTHDITVYFDYVSSTFIVTDITNNALDNHVASLIGTTTALPLDEIGFGTGSGITSSPTFRFNKTKSSLFVNEADFYGGPVAPYSEVWIGTGFNTANNGASSIKLSSTYAASYGDPAYGTSNITLQAGNTQLDVNDFYGSFIPAGSIFIYAGNATGDWSPPGGEIVIKSGSSTGTSGGTNHPGNVNISAGDAAGDDEKGANVILRGGNGNGNGADGGNIHIFPGSGGGGGGVDGTILIGDEGSGAPGPVLVYGSGASLKLIKNLSTGNKSRLELLAPEIKIGDGPITTTATSGFPWIPTMAGTPTGNPGTITGMVPIIVDTSTNKLWIRFGSTWLSVTFT